jgi:hypothetical protein
VGGGNPWPRHVPLPPFASHRRHVAWLGAGCRRSHWRQGPAGNFHMSKIQKFCMLRGWLCSYTPLQGGSAEQQQPYARDHVPRLPGGEGDHAALATSVSTLLSRRSLDNQINHSSPLITLNYIYKYIFSFPHVLVSTVVTWRSKKKSHCKPSPSLYASTLRGATL